MLATILFIIFMVFWLFGGGFFAYENSAFNGRRFLGYSLIPWLCVAVLGYIVITGVPPQPLK